jgi:ABC-type Mn2+/Zn2+ transport system ATPase subunit
MTNTFTEKLGNLWQNYIVDNIEYVNFAAPFLFFRVCTPFYHNEPIPGRLLEGIAFAASASIVKYNVDNQNFDDYSLSYVPVFGSFVYHSIEHSNPAVKIIAAVTSSILLEQAQELRLLPQLLQTTIIYGIAKINNIPNSYAFALSAISGLDGILYPDDRKVSWGNVGMIIYNGQNLPYNQLGFQIGTMASMYEEQILDQLFAINHFKSSYETFAKIMEPQKLNLLLEEHYIIAANLQIGIGFLGNLLLISNQERIGQFSKIMPKDLEKHSQFVTTSFYYLAFALEYTATRTLSDIVSVYHTVDLMNKLQSELDHNAFLDQKFFIHTAKADHTAISYKTDLNTLFSSDDEIIQNYMFGLAKLTKTVNLNPGSYLGIGLISAWDYLFNILFQHLISQKKVFSEQKEKCESSLTILGEHSKEYASSILQKNSLNFTAQEWENLSECMHTNYLKKTMASKAIDTLGGFYNQEVLNSLLHLIVANICFKGAIEPKELFLYARTLQVLVSSILFKSRNLAGFEETESAAKRLNELFEHINKMNSSITKINFNIDETQDYLKIKNLDFTRGSNTQKSHVIIDELTLNLGKFYAITGPNGSGKSSLSTLLQYVLGEISDPSFMIANGTITYPSSKIDIIPQKDYIPLKMNLLDVVMHPVKLANVSSFNQTKIINHINELQVFQNDINSDDLYKTQESWKDLSGGQKKKLFLIKEFITCPKVLILDELFGPLDPNARKLVMNKIEQSCLKEAMLLVVWHQDQNPNNSNCVTERFFDYELHLENTYFTLSKVDGDCL